MGKKKNAAQSAKERMRKYRERIKQDPQKHEEMKQKERARWKRRVNENKIRTAASKITKEERIALQKQWREKSRKYRAKMKEKKQLQEENSLPSSLGVQIANYSETNKPIKLENEIKTIASKTTEQKRKVLWIQWREKARIKTDASKKTERERSVLQKQQREKTIKYQVKIKEETQLQEEKYLPSSPEVQIVNDSEINKPIKLVNKINTAASKMTKQKRKVLRIQWREKTRKYHPKMKEKKQVQEEKPLPVSPDVQTANDSETNKPVKLENEIKTTVSTMSEHKRKSLRIQWGEKTRKDKMKMNEQSREEKSLPCSPDVQISNDSEANKPMKFENEIKTTASKTTEQKRKVLRIQWRERTRKYQLKMKEKKQGQKEKSLPVSLDVKIANDSETDKSVKLENEIKTTASKMTKYKRKSLRIQWRDKTSKSEVKMKINKQLHEEKSLLSSSEVQIVNDSETNTPMTLVNKIKTAASKTTEQKRKVLRIQWREETRKYQLKMKKKQAQEEKYLPVSTDVQIANDCETNKPVELENEIRAVDSKMTERERRVLLKHRRKKTIKSQAKMKEKTQLQEEKSQSPDVTIVNDAETNKSMKSEDKRRNNGMNMRLIRKQLKNKIIWFLF